MDFVTARLFDERWLRVLTVVDQFTRECLQLLADSSLTRQTVTLALSQVIAERGTPVSITLVWKSSDGRVGVLFKQRSAAFPARNNAPRRRLHIV